MLSEYYTAAKKAAAVAEKDGFGIIKLAGSERVTWLQGMITNDVEKLRPGTGCYAAHLTPQGRIVAHMRVLIDEEAIWLSLERATVASLMAAFDKLLIMEDVQMEDASGQYSVIAVLGPNAAQTLESWMNEPLQVTAKYAHRPFEDCRIVVSDVGYEVWVPVGRTDNILRRLAQSGATAIDRGTWDVLRTEAGLPVYGVDIDESTTMPEIGEAGISYEKGCYIGQEVVAKVKYIGHVNRRFVGLIISGTDLPDLKAPVRKGEREVGYVTTALFSPGLQKPIALGFVSRAAYAPGSIVDIAGNGKTLTAEIVDLPFKISEVNT